MFHAIKIRYWARTIEPEARSNSNLSDGCVVRSVQVASEVVRRLRARGCAIHSEDVIQIIRPDCGPIYEDADEYDRLGSMSLAELDRIKKRNRCIGCGDILTGHEDESGTHCRWCVTCHGNSEGAEDGRRVL